MSRELLSVLVVFGAVIIFSAVGIGWTLLQQWWRARQMLTAAERMGFSFDRGGRSLLQEGITEVPIFSFVLLRQGEILSLMKDRTGSSPVIICDYHYWLGSVGARFDHSQTVFCFDVKQIPLPDFSLQPRSNAAEKKLLKFGLNLARVAKPLAGGLTRILLDSAISGVNEGVEFGEHPAFTARYRLSGSDPQKVKSLFGAGVLEFLGQQEGTLFSVEKSGDWLVIYKKDVLAEPEGLPARLSEARSIRALFGGSALPPI